MLLYGFVNTHSNVFCCVGAYEENPAEVHEGPLSISHAQGIAEGLVFAELSRYLSDVLLMFVWCVRFSVYVVIMTSCFCFGFFGDTVETMKKKERKRPCSASVGTENRFLCPTHGLPLPAGMERTVTKDTAVLFDLHCKTCLCAIIIVAETHSCAALNFDGASAHARASTAELCVLRCASTIIRCRVSSFVDTLSVCYSTSLDDHISAGLSIIDRTFHTPACRCVLEAAFLSVKGMGR